MTKKILLLLPFVAVSSLVGCQLTTDASSSIELSSTTSIVKDYYLVEFDYNNAAKTGTYLNVVVNKGKTLERPKDPNIAGYVFDGWYTDKDCTLSYRRWGLEIDKDMVLYAKWSDFKDLNPSTSLDRFAEALEPLCCNATKVNKEISASFMYPTLSESIFYVEDKYVFTRYKDITIKDYYYTDDGKTYTLYGSEQFYYTDSYFYQIFKSFDKSVQDETKTSTFNKSKITSFLSIDFTNLYGLIREQISFYLDNPDDYVIDKNFTYDFTGDYTQINERPSVYTWKEEYWAATYSDTAGTWSGNEYDYEYSVVIINNKVTNIHILANYNYILGDEYYYVSSEEQALDFYYGDGSYPSFTGERYTA